MCLYQDFLEAPWEVLWTLPQMDLHFGSGRLQSLQSHPLTQVSWDVFPAGMLLVGSSRHEGGLKETAAKMNRSDRGTA